MIGERISRPGIYRYEDIPWLRRDLMPVQYTDRGASFRRTGTRPTPAPGEADAVLSLATESCRGKITDAGYDQALCQYFRLPADRDLRFTAVLRMARFPRPGECTGQEGAGLFLRDTMGLDRATGYPYSNMLLAGACFGGWHGFLRTGIAGGIGQVKNERHSFGAVPASPPSGAEVEICLERVGDAVLAGIRPAQGDARWEPEELWEMPAGADALFQRDRRWLYAGFLAAADCSAEIRKGSVRVELRARKRSWSRRWEKKADCIPPVRAPSLVVSAEATPLAEPVPDVFVSPDGMPNGLGTPAAPWDLRTAVERCRPWQTIRLRPGLYRLTEDIVLAGSAGNRLVCGPDEEDYAVLDFQGSPHCLAVDGDRWELQGIAVVRGLGIQIRGKGNRLSRCAAAFNLETGILIRAARNDAPPEDWPAGNAVSDCVSFGNLDPTEHNADGFACKVAAGEGNSFLRCRAFLNADDGFDLFSKNLPTGPVHLERCTSALNGYRLENGAIRETKGNGNGFKLGGSGQAVRHTVRLCEAHGNKQYGFTSNSNPWFCLARCIAGNNKAGNYRYYFTAPGAKGRKDLQDCAASDDTSFDTEQLLQQEIGRGNLWALIQEAIG